MAIRTLEDLEARLTADLKWRNQELFSWEKQVERTKDLTRSGLLRGGWALIYAHWEGYVKSSGVAYLEWVSRKGLKLSDLRDELAAVSIRASLQKLAEEKNPERHTEIVTLVREEALRPAELPYTDAMIRTNSNLNFKAFSSIMHALGCDASAHDAHKMFIDSRLLKQRNGIAHGRKEYVELEEWVEGRDIVMKILRDVRTQIANAAALNAHLR
ncbi:hypothetical protein KRR39_20900 [Nocardioides panacis]|uniref:MAE-28990/MAE-18760-like HEPN domain-containing protein n=1 Tax=Nocardioides panacis TaxID=2849501 RepID=A0A975SYZ7_9ACTN|nr:MAE_28990/MAE_18760 family HEPN-like nuclease [Nocardioides panacis]QWZ07818.1 hypothetical protein KRR39_20900 [Nocardioides panacis]